MRYIFIIALFVATLCVAQQAASPQLVSSFDAKIHRVDENGKLARPKAMTTTLTQDEINAYFASGELKLPNGVQSLRTQLESQTVTGFAHVDFDQVRANHPSSNPLLSVFSGTHDVKVLASADGEGGTANVHIASAEVDGVEVPQFVLEMFINKYVKPKYPEVGIDSTFHMPAKVDRAQIDNGRLILTQR